MKAMVMDAQRTPLEMREIQRPSFEAHEVLLKVRCCAVCRTDLHVLDGDLQNPKLPLILGHEIVGVVEEVGASVQSIAPSLQPGTRVGVPWLGHTCGQCAYCNGGKENLCDRAEFTGYTRNGGYAEYAVADARFCFPLPEQFSDESAAPLLCAGLIGWRSLMFAGDARKLGIYGFGAAAHIISQVAIQRGHEVYAFTSPADVAKQDFARSLGCAWAGDSTSSPPELLDAAIIFAPVGSLVPEALKNIRKGGAVVCGGIHMSRIPAFNYDLLWGERRLLSVANLTRQDGIEFFAALKTLQLNLSTAAYPLANANEAITDLRSGRIHGAAVLKP